MKKTDKRSVLRRIEDNMAKKVKCGITVTEVDGKVVILANIPDDCKDTVAGALTLALIERSAEVMNAVLGENKTVETISSH